MIYCRVIALTLTLGACFSSQPAVEDVSESAAAPAVTASAVSGNGREAAAATGNCVGIFGTASDDRLAGTAADDVFFGGDGDDVIEGGDGDDVLYGDQQDEVDACGPGQAKPDSAARFLLQASFGGNPETIAEVERIGLSAWFRAQLAEPATLHLPMIQQPGNMNRGAVTDSFWRAAIEGEDQLRQRVAYALSQILVISTESGTLERHPDTAAVYMDILTEGALGNYRDLLGEVARSQAMGSYLTHAGNEKGDPAKGTKADENFAREVMQLFTIGLYELNADGTPRLDAGGEPIPTYTGEDVSELARVFTGMSHPSTEFIPGRAPVTDYTLPMQVWEEFHDRGTKTVMGKTLRGGNTSEDVDAALDLLFDHPNVGPFVGRILIQRLIKSNPSPAYVGRVSAAFDAGRARLPDDSTVGTGRRGDLTATVAAILFNEEARTPSVSEVDGKVREPVLRVAQFFRAFRPADATLRPDLTFTENLQRNHEDDRLAQGPYRAPSVFNFYRPGFRAASSATGERGLDAPELQIANSAAITGYFNLMYRLARQDHPEGRFFPITYERYLPYGDDPARLIDALDEVLTHGAMAPEAKARLAQIIEASPYQNGLEDKHALRRTRLAVLLMVTSPEYMSQR